MVPTCAFTKLSFECAKSESIGMSRAGILGYSAAGFVGRRLLSWQISPTKLENREEKLIGTGPQRGCPNPVDRQSLVR